jgi:hypothetical protein
LAGLPALAALIALGSGLGLQTFRRASVRAPIPLAACPAATPELVGYQTRIHRVFELPGGGSSLEVVDYVVHDRWVRVTSPECSVTFTVPHRIVEFNPAGRVVCTVGEPLQVFPARSGPR